MSDNKEDSVMGFPRSCNKRRWSGDAEDELDESPSKVVCKSSSASFRLYLSTPAIVPCSGDSSETMECDATPLEEPNDNEETLTGSDCDENTSDHPQDKDDDDDNFIDDEEDKDSGFIDGNSIDNSSDEEMEANKTNSFSASSESEAPKQDLTSCETNLKISLSKVFLVPSSCEDDKIPPLSSSSRRSAFLSTPQSSETTTSVTTTTLLPTLVELSRVETSFLTTVTGTQAGTLVTKSYQGLVPTTTYDLSSYQPSYSEIYQPRPCTPSWSCTFYDGSQPSTTNKYMEISPNRSLMSQSIQCDENGKSYIELGNATSPPNAFGSNVSNFTTTTTTTTFNSSSYSQSFSGQQYSGNPYFNNSRPNYSMTPSYNNYSHGEQHYSNFEGGNLCSYGYTGNTYSSNSSGKAGTSVNRPHPQRCSSPICDPTKTSPRPPCYQQQRFSVLNMSMFKLNRFSRFPEPSLHRSVLICNTLRQIEKELDREGVNMTSLLTHTHPYGANGQSLVLSPNSAEVERLETLPSMASSVSPSVNGSLQTATNLPPTICRIVSSVPFTTTEERSIPYPSSPRVGSTQFVHREDQLPPISNIQTIIPVGSSLSTTEEVVEGEGSPPTQSLSVQNIPPTNSEDRAEGSINWCSVLSLSSQTDLDSMNNNECNEWNNETEVPPLAEAQEPLPSPSSEVTTPSWKLPSLSADDVLKSFPEGSRRPEEESDSIINVIVGS